jgi:hypothetical protein
MSLIAAFCTKSGVLGAPHPANRSVANVAITKLRMLPPRRFTTVTRQRSEEFQCFFLDPFFGGMAPFGVMQNPFS